jgi:hypothetical protein
MPPTTTAKGQRGKRCCSHRRNGHANPHRGTIPEYQLFNAILGQVGTRKLGMVLARIRIQGGPIQRPPGTTSPGQKQDQQHPHQQLANRTITLQVHSAIQARSKRNHGRPRLSQPLVALQRNTPGDHGTLPVRRTYAFLDTKGPLGDSHRGELTY